MKKITDGTTQYFPGFYRAYVENNGFGSGESDPEKRNRVQVRVLGVHSQNKTDSLTDGIPTENLPWAEQASPTLFGFGPSGGGVSHVPEDGSWVWVFFENGNHNKPVYFASMAGNNQADDKTDSDVVVINSKAGHKITINDTDGEESIEIEDSKNKNKITLNNEGVTIETEEGTKVETGKSLEPMVLGDTLYNYLTSLKSYVDNHAHTDPLSGVTGIPLVPSPSIQDFRSDKNEVD